MEACSAISYIYSWLGRVFYQGGQGSDMTLILTLLFMHSSLCPMTEITLWDSEKPFTTIYKIHEPSIERFKIISIKRKKKDEMPWCIYGRVLEVIFSFVFPVIQPRKWPPHPVVHLSSSSVFLLPSLPLLPSHSYVCERWVVIFFYLFIYLWVLAYKWPNL